MLCVDCDKGFHYACLHLDSVPSGNWHCPGCRYQTAAGISPIKKLKPTTSAAEPREARETKAASGQTKVNRDVMGK